MEPPRLGREKSNAPVKEEMPHRIWGILEPLLAGSLAHHSIVIAGLVPAIHLGEAWTTGTRPVVTPAGGSRLKDE
jgi:hypothetical protein